MDITQQLYQLQEIDSERDKHQQRLQEISGQLGETEALRAARAKVTQLEAELTRWRTRRRDLELETQSLETKIASVEERMYSGRVTNPKELTDLQNESIALRKWRGVLDEKSLEAMLVIEENEAKLHEAQAASSTIKTSWTTQQQSLKQERAQLEEQLAKLDQARADHVRNIQANTLGQYESLRQAKNGIAVAIIEDAFCRVCGVEVSDRKLAQVIQGDSLVFCGSCGRILVE